MRRLTPFVVSTLGVLAGCSLIVGADAVQCDTSADCEGRGPAFVGSVCTEGRCRAVAAPLEASVEAEAASAGPWDCLGHVVVPPADSSKRHTFTAAIHNSITTAPIAGVTLRMCLKTDAQCASPLTPDQVTDDAGNAVFPVPEGIALFVLGTPPTGSTFIPIVGHIPPLFSDGSAPFTMLDEVSFEGFFPLVGIEENADDGHVFVPTGNCFGDFLRGGAGISLEIEGKGPDTTRFYLANGLPSRSATQTDPSGQGALGGFVNVPPGINTITATYAPTGQRSASDTLIVKKGYITFLPLAPN